MKNSLAVLFAALVLLLPLASCAPKAEGQATSLPAATEQPTQTSAETSTSREEASTEEDRSSFLSLLGITEKTVPFYEYYDDDGALQLELYYDTAKEEGVGIYYGTYLYEVSAASFLVGAAEKTVWIDRKYLITSEHKDNDVNYFSTLPNYKENSANNKQGKPTMFHATMSAEDGYGGTFTRDLIKITWDYRDDGTLRHKNKVILDDGYRGSERFYYDSKERLVYVNAYITSGTLEDYYIYQGISKTPSYRLTLHHGFGPTAVQEFVKY